MTTVEALKNLCAALKGNETKAEDISGTTIPEVIDQITKAIKAKATE